MEIIALVVLILTIVGGAIYSFNIGEKKGTESEKLDQANEALDDIKKANDVVDHWNSDPAFRDRVRHKYTKK
jgi:hypothetical protein